MININKLIKISGLLVFIFAMNACHEEPDWLEDNTTTEGKHFPVIAGFSVVDQAESYHAGDVIQLDLDYWSVDDIQTVKIWENVEGTMTEVSSQPYAANFQEDSQTDEMLISYTVPNFPNDSTTVTFDAEVINVNGLTRNTADGGTANRPSVDILVVFE